MYLGLYTAYGQGIFYDEPAKQYSSPTKTEKVGMVH